MKAPVFRFHLIFLAVVVSRAGAAGLEVNDGFETAGLSANWSTDRFEPGAVIIQTNVVRSGRSAVQITVHPRDKFEAGRPGTSDSERAELMEAARFFSRENQAYEFAFSLYFPTNFPIVPTRLVIAQWKQLCPDGGNCSDDSPVLALRYISGELRITQNLDRPHEARLYTEKGEFRGRWLDFRFQVRFATNETGWVKAWLDGRPLVDFKGVTANSENPVTGYRHPGLFYFKVGLYRNSVPAPWTSYIDEYRKRELPGDAL